MIALIGDHVHTIIITETSYDINCIWANDDEDEYVTKESDYEKGVCIPPPLRLYDDNEIIDIHDDPVFLGEDWYQNTKEEDVQVLT